MAIPDKEQLLARWRERGEKPIPLPTGGDIYDLETYLDFYGYPDFEGAIKVVRRYLEFESPPLLMVPLNEVGKDGLPDVG